MSVDCILNLHSDSQGCELVCRFLVAAVLQGVGAQPVLTTSVPTADWAATANSAVVPQDTLAYLLANWEEVRLPGRIKWSFVGDGHLNDPAGRSSTLPSGDLLVKRSVTHQVFGPPNRAFKSEPAKPPRSNLFLPGRNHPPSTAYRSDFTDPGVHRPETPSMQRPSTATGRLEEASSQAPPAPRKLVRCQSAPACGRKPPSDNWDEGSSTTASVAPRPASAVARLQALLCRNEEIFKVRRACYLSPGQ
ncbi:hypothetical protein AK812_SmicGene29418 [Symbiodinium microadriaticum]|uniref:Uncharacterized protein n=1 Tax=Symbiodinium microadriaticum TaxID=2951 RepID=A0A1Q9D1W9_SYMMI|nr:hypothetical protein AK812_SmicGene29418 [Symbiodinium microadriaticum]